jgi:Rps23 Pro-64 3,4-dihydroxylase Tpa1-like proline 4-hydroxylase
MTLKKGLQMRHLKTSSGKNIYLYDDLFNYAERYAMYGFIKNSMFTTSGKDTNRLEHQGHFNIYSSYSEQDVKNLGVMNNVVLKNALSDIGDLKITQARVNLSTLNDKNHFHSDELDGITLLYYPNMEWHLEWGGYTLFSDDATKNIEHCLVYTPGRVVIFEGNIPHCIAAPTNIAPTYRFSFAIQFKKGQ